MRNSLEAKGDDTRSYNVAMGISFDPAKNLNAEQMIEAVTKNKKVSEKLIYGMQAALRKDPVLNCNKKDAIAALSAFDEELGTLPQDAGANMLLEFTVSNPHETEIVDDAQKAINAIQQVEKPEIVPPGAKPTLVKG